ncbi:MAG: YicC family protein, partial [Christensenellaceae bacterium]
MYSMTGYGKGEWKGETCDLTIEIKTVNNRYLDIALKAPKSFLAYEETIRSRIKEKMTRGHVDVFVTYTDRRETKEVVRVDVALARSYLEAARTLSAELDVPQDVTTSYLMKCPDVVRTEESAEEDERITQALDYALGEALTRLNEMRAVEGKKLEEDLLSRMETIEKTVALIRTRAPLVTEEYRKRLEERLRTYLTGVEIDESRLLTEVA